MVAEMTRAEAKGKDPLDELSGQLKQRAAAMAPLMGEGVSLTETKEDKLIELTAAKPASMAAAMAMLKDLEGTKLQSAEEITVKLK